MMARVICSMGITVLGIATATAEYPSHSWFGQISFFGKKLD
jgi:hypothetical protein